MDHRRHLPAGGDLAVCDLEIAIVDWISPPKSKRRRVTATNAIDPFGSVDFLSNYEQLGGKVVSGSSGRCWVKKKIRGAIKNQVEMARRVQSCARISTGDRLPMAAPTPRRGGQRRREESAIRSLRRGRRRDAKLGEGKGGASFRGARRSNQARRHVVRLVTSTTFNGDSTLLTLSGPSFGFLDRQSRVERFFLIPLRVRRSREWTAPSVRVFSFR